MIIYEKNDNIPPGDGDLYQYTVRYKDVITQQNGSKEYWARSKNAARKVEELFIRRNPEKAVLSIGVD